MEKLEWLNKNIGDNGDKNYQYRYVEGSSLLNDLKQEYLKLNDNNKDKKVFVPTIQRNNKQYLYSVDAIH